MARKPGSSVIDQLVSSYFELPVRIDWGRASGMPFPDRFEDAELEFSGLATAWLDLSEVVWRADEVHFMSTVHTKSIDGGATFTTVAGGDGHDMWIDPMLPDRMIDANDQGVRISTNRGRSWYSPLLPIAQMYHVFTDTKVPYNLYGNRQDGPSSGGPSNTLTGGPIPIEDRQPAP